MLAAENLCFAYKKHKPILKDISLTVNSGEVVCILGPNGTGKTTMLRCLLGLNKPSKGRVLVDTTVLSAISISKKAKYLAYVPQYASMSFPYTVQEIVLMGRTAYLAYGKPLQVEDFDKANWALEKLGIGDLAEETFSELSGGQQQMVLLARALTQDARILVLDEPTANLDFSNQVKMLKMIKKLANDGYGIVMTSHFPDHAFLTESKVVLMQNGSKLQEGNPEEIITSQALTALYQTAIEVTETKVCNCGKKIRVCVPILNK